MPASVTIIPEKERPTRTVGPSCRASTRSAEATASGSVVRGFCTAVTLSSAACNLAITSDQHDASAKSPCTRTTFRAIGADRAASAPRIRVLAAPAAAMLTNVRRFIGLPRVQSWGVAGFELAIWTRGCQQLWAVFSTSSSIAVIAFRRSRSRIYIFSTRRHISTRHHGVVISRDSEFGAAARSPAIGQDWPQSDGPLSVRQRETETFSWIGYSSFLARPEPNL